MTAELILKGLLIGLILALPTGPVGILCLRRTLVAGWRAGLVSGVGVCFADLFYVIVARFGLTEIERLVNGQRFALQLVAGLIVILAGCRIIASPPARLNCEQTRHGGLFMSAFLMCVTNPTMLVSIPALFAVMRYPAVLDVFSTMITVVCVFAGSMIWWWMITRWLDRSSESFSDRTLRRVSTFAGAALIALGVISISTSMA